MRRIPDAQTVNAPLTQEQLQEQLFVEPPAALRLLINDLFASNLSDTGLPRAFLIATQIAPDVLSQLNEFASLVAQRPNSRIVAIQRCTSCYKDNIPGHLVTTEDGLQCWKCDPNV